MKEFAPFRLDRANQCLWRHGKTPDEERVLLKPKAFGVLQYLVDHAGRLVTQDELLDALWPDTHVQPEVLKSQILRIRNALGDRARCPHFIETQPRRGYRFIAPVHDGAYAFPLIRPTPLGRLVGRARQLRDLAACLDSAAHDECRILFLAGEPGIGKTALVDEFLRCAASTTSIRIARGQCLEGYGGKEAYYPMLEALGALCRGPDGPGLVQILGDQAPTWLVQFPALLTREHRQTLQREIQGATRERMLREICEAIESLTAAGPLLLIFEDLQWVDPSTVDLIAALARCRRPIRLMLLATYRPADAALADHPLSAVKRDLLGHRLCREIVLAPLTEEDVAGYLAGELPLANLPKGLAALVYRHSEGNPLFMVAALDHMTESGFLAHENGEWRLLVPLQEIDVVVPESLRQMIEAQIEGLTVEERRVLEAASIAGAIFSPIVSAAAAGLSPDGFEEHCEELSRRHRLVRHADAPPLADASAGQRFEFVHALYREVCYRRQASGRRASLHRRTGLRLEELFPERLSDLAPELAHHFEAGSEWARAVRYLRLMAETARRRYAHREAAAILEHALELLHWIPEAERAIAEIEITEKLAPTYLVLFDPRAIQTYEALAARAARIGRIDIEIDALVDLALPLASISTQRYIEVLEQALRLSVGQSDPILRARTRATCLVRRMAASGWNAHDADECRASLEFTRRSGNRESLASQLIDCSFVQSLSSEYRQAYRNAAESVVLLSQQGFPENPYLNVAHWLMHRSLLFLGDWGEAQRAIDAAIAGVEKNGDSYRIHTLSLYRAWVHLCAMDFAGALEICESVRPCLRSVRSPAGTRHCLVLSGLAEAGLEHFEAARQHLMEARDGMDREIVLLDWYWRIPVESSLTEIWLAQRNLPQARLQAERFLRTTLATAERTWQALAWDANARVASAGEDADQASQCIRQALSTLEGYEAPMAAWRVHATAAEFYQRRGDIATAARHRELSRATILKLANSLAADSPLRKAFLSAPYPQALLTFSS